MSIETYKAVESLLSKIEAPQELISIPALQGVYDDSVIKTVIDDPDSNEIMVRVQPMVTSDEKFFASIDAFSNGTGIMKLLQLRVEGLKQPEKLYPSDVVTLANAIRAVSFGPEINTDVKCSSCGSEFTATVDTRALPITHYDATELDKTITLSNEQTVRYRPVTFLEEVRLDKVEDITEQYVARIISVDDVEDRLAIRKWVEKLPIRYSKELFAAFSKINLGGIQDSNIPVKCEACGTENKISIDILAGFFIEVLR